VLGWDVDGTGCNHQVNARRLTLLAGAAALALLSTTATGSASASGSSPSPSPSAAATSAPETVTYGLGPSTKGKLDLRAGYRLITTPGGSVADEVAVVNVSDVPLTLNLYAVDAVSGADGEVGLKAAADKLEDAAAWVSFRTPSGKGFVKLKPRETVFVPFTVAVPKNAPVGDHVAGVVVSTVATGQSPGDRAASVTLEQRVALKLAVRVAGELNPQLTVEGLEARYFGTLNPFGSGSATVTYTVRNTGNVRLGGTQSVSVTNLLGSTASAASVPDVPLLLPGGSATFTVPVDGVSPLVVMRADVRIFPVAAEGDANPSTLEVGASTMFWAVPWLLIALLLLLVLAVAAYLRNRRRDTPAAGRRERSAGGTDLVGASR
jgi:hypothetical protein